MLEDWLPAGLEYLACGTGDNTTEAPTNPGSDRGVSGLGPDQPGQRARRPRLPRARRGRDRRGRPRRRRPDAARPSTPTSPGAGSGDLAVGESRKIQYVAAVPIRENTLDWPHGEPDPASTDQASNLDNNSGAETQDEQPLTNYAQGFGDFDGVLPVTDSGTKTVTAEDIRILKSVSNGELAQGDVERWTLRIDTGEYRYVDDVRVTDTLPDGYCPLGSQNFEHTPPAAEAECSPTRRRALEALHERRRAGRRQLEARLGLLDRPRARADGALVEPHDQLPDEDARELPGELRRRGPDPGARRPLELGLAARRGLRPLRPRRRRRLRAALGRRDRPRRAQRHRRRRRLRRRPVGARPDDREADLGRARRRSTATPPTTSPRSRSTAPATRSAGSSASTSTTALDTRTPVVTDFLPPHTAYVSGSAHPTADNTVTIASFDDSQAADDVLSWTLGDSGYADRSQVFEVVLATTVEGYPDARSGDIAGNLMKFSHTNTAGRSFPLRARRDFAIDLAELTLLKGVKDVNNVPAAGNGPNVDNVAVRGGDRVTYRVDITNNGTRAARQTQVWDKLPTGIACADVFPGSISDGGACNAAQNRIEWTLPADIAPSGGTKQLNYDVIIPSASRPEQNYVNTAGVRRYESATNEGGTYERIPKQNIDPAQEPNANADVAKDTSRVFTPDLTIAKTRTTEVTQSGNDLNTQATIGEEINYTVRITVPHGTTIHSSALTDALGTRQTYVPGSADGEAERRRAAGRLHAHRRRQRDRPAVPGELRERPGLGRRRLRDHLQGEGRRRLPREPAQRRARSDELDAAEPRRLPVARPGERGPQRELDGEHDAGRAEPRDHQGTQRRRRLRRPGPGRPLHGHPAQQQRHADLDRQRPRGRRHAAGRPDAGRRRRQPDRRRRRRPARRRDLERERPHDHLDDRVAGAGRERREALRRQGRQRPDLDRDAAEHGARAHLRPSRRRRRRRRAHRPRRDPDGGPRLLGDGERRACSSPGPRSTSR